MSVSVDTSAWFAAINRKDQNHHRAAEIFSREKDLVTSDYVLVETWLLIKNRVGFKTAPTFWSAIKGGLARLEKVTDTDLQRAWTVGEDFSDQSFSLVDLSCFVMVERLRLTRVISFDTDFVIYRYGQHKDRAFEVLR